VEQMTIGRLTVLTTEAGRALTSLGESSRNPPESVGDAQDATAASRKPIPVEIHNPPTTPMQMLQTIIASVWGPLETLGVVLIVLMFVLLEHEALRDRLILLLGGKDLRATTIAINDAEATLSRFFASQFAVNGGVGVIIGIGLTIVGLPHALLWAALTAVLRFIPYVGVWIAALSSALFAAAVTPGWSLMIATLTCYLIVEPIAAQWVEPYLYGHATGLSPLTVVISAVFWGWLWGPIGLIVSTPMTLCLLIAGRYTNGLRFLAVLLGEAPALTMPQQLYERALSEDPQELIANARRFLKRRSFVEYCDSVIMPALVLARLDSEHAAISKEQQLRVRFAIVSLVEALGNETVAGSRKHRRTSVLDEIDAGRQLRRQRELRAGPWQGPIEVPAESVVLCLGLGSPEDDLATELLVRVFRGETIDARHLSLADIDAPSLPRALAERVAQVFIVSTLPGEETDSADRAASALNNRFAHARLIAVLIQGLDTDRAGPHATMNGVERAVNSFAEALQICVERQSVPQSDGPSGRGLPAT
jgi:predicted PurR-regulated permease PerM